MVLGEISYAVILGKPVLFWLGLLAIIFLICTYLAWKLPIQNKLKYHKTFAVLTGICGAAHAILAIAQYF